MIDEYGALVGMRSGRGNRRILRKAAPVPLVSHKSHMTYPKIEPGPPQGEAGD
jgi:hypothetical protein